MSHNTNLDDYLAGLGISDADENAPPAHTPETSGPHAATLHAAPEEPRTVLERFFKGLTSRIDPGLSYSIQEQEDAFEVDINGENAPRLAGRDGQTLHAIEIIAYTVLTKQAGRADVRVRVDIGGFRKRQADTLAKLAERLAVQVAKSGEVHELQPMPAADRRIVHMTLKENPDVMTESVGEGASRRLIIKPRHG